MDLRGCIQQYYYAPQRIIVEHSKKMQEPNMILRGYTLATLQQVDEHCIEIISNKKITTTHYAHNLSQVTHAGELLINRDQSSIPSTFKMYENMKSLKKIYIMGFTDDYIKNDSVEQICIGGIYGNSVTIDAPNLRDMYFTFWSGIYIVRAHPECVFHIYEWSV